MRRTTLAIAQGRGAGPPSGSALPETSRQRSSAPVIGQPVELGLPVEPRIDGIAERLPAVLQPHVGHPLFLDPGEQQKLAYRAAQNRIRQRVRHGRPLHDVARDIHARVRRQFANARPFARRRHHRVLATALRRPAAHEGAPRTLQRGLMQLIGAAFWP